MPSSAIKVIAEDICGCPVLEIRRLRGGGGNNRLYHIETTAESFALKAYPQLKKGGYDRLKAEFNALEFLRTSDVTCVPDAIAFDEKNRYALYQWIDGEKIGPAQQHDLDAAAKFIGKLYELAHESPGSKIGKAAEACLCGAELMAQVKNRFSNLQEVAAKNPELSKFLNENFQPFFTTVIERAQDGYNRAGRDFNADIILSKRTFSPSDFGFHNALRKADGEIAFLDFEYFGWDDPVRLIADFILHPGMALSPADSRTFVELTLPIFAADEGFTQRLNSLYPLIGLRWCMIILNEFLPERWSGREFAGATDLENSKQRQLGKVNVLLTRLHNELETNNGFPYAA